MDRKSGLPGAEEAWALHLAQHPEDHALAAELDHVWHDLGRVGAPELRLAQSVPDAVVTPFRTRRRPLRWAVPVGLAASIALVFGLTELHQERAPGAAARQFAAGDQTRKLRLADGSFVTLAAHAVIAIQLRPAERLLELQSGEAYFEVAHDKARPFSVSTRYGTTTAVGTAFNIQADKGQTLVAVTEGTVRVAPAGSNEFRMVSRDHQVSFQPDPDNGRARLGTITAIDDREANEWTTGFLHFDGARLDTVIVEVNRHTSQHLVLENPSLAGMPIYAILKVGEVDGLLALVAAQQHLDPAAMRHSLRVEGNI